MAERITICCTMITFIMLVASVEPPVVRKVVKVHPRNGSLWMIALTLCSVLTVRSMEKHRRAVRERSSILTVLRLSTYTIIIIIIRPHRTVLAIIHQDRSPMTCTRRGIIHHLAQRPTIRWATVVVVVLLRLLDRASIVAVTVVTVVLVDHFHYPTLLPRHLVFPVPRTTALPAVDHHHRGPHVVTRTRAIRWPSSVHRPVSIRCDHP
uniref:Secreted protein n=1 Tax=Anopheles darlingi TaxID=43151 RepID=A0A2M4D9K8_ANODA